MPTGWRAPEQAFAGLGLLAALAAPVAWLLAPGAAGLVGAAVVGACAVGLAWAHRARRDARALHELAAAARALHLGRAGATLALPDLDAGPALTRCIDQLQLLVAGLQQRIDLLEQRSQSASERERIARQLQDAAAQTQFAAYLQAGVLARAAHNGGDHASSTWAEPLEALERLNRCAMAETRLLRFELGSPEASRSTLADRLQPAIDALVSRCPALIVHSRMQLDDLLDPATRTGIARLALAALSNVQAHSGAGELTVEWTAPHDGPARLHIGDDGKGFDPTAAPAGSGLRRMHDQAQAIGATLSIDSAPGRGTDILLTLPA